MSTNAEDLLYFANVQHDIYQYAAATEYLKMLVDVKPKLDKKERTLFGIIYKDAIDPVRNTLRILKTNAQECKEGPELDMLKAEIETSLNDLQSLCEGALTLINDKLLPSAEEASSRTYYNKMKGDLFRYLYEFAENGKEELLQNADMSYTVAIEVASTELSSQDPIRLGTVLNYAVFLYEHMKKEDDAVNILREALFKAENETKTLTDNSRKESVTIIEVMQTNLSNWASDSEGEEEEVR